MGHSKLSIPCPDMSLPLTATQCSFQPNGMANCPRVQRALYTKIPLKIPKNDGCSGRVQLKLAGFFPFPPVFTYTQAFCTVRQAGERKDGRIRRWGVGRLSIRLSSEIGVKKLYLSTYIVHLQNLLAFKNIKIITGLPPASAGVTSRLVYRPRKLANVLTTMLYYSLH